MPLFIGSKLGAVSLRDLGFKLHHSGHALVSFCDTSYVWLKFVNRNLAIFTHPLEKIKISNN